MRIAVLGEPRWTRVAEHLLRRAGLDASAVTPSGRMGLLRWAWREGRAFDAVHHLTGPGHWRTSLALSMLNKPIVWHWIGTDFLNFRDHSRGGLAGWINRRAAFHPRGVHLADSPRLAGELEEVGIVAAVSRLLPERIEASALPLPRRFAALSYWSDGRMEFYGGRTIFALAEAFPDVPFRIVGATGRGVAAPANVEFLGPREDMERVYLESSVLIRLPEHDSLSAMVLEMLARGRYVIYNQPLEACETASTLNEACEALARVRARTEPNEAGSRLVAERFSLDEEARKLAGIYASLMGKARP